MNLKRSLTGIALATIVLVSICAACASTSASAANETSANAARALSSVPSGIVGAPAVCSQDANSKDLFIRGTDNALWWNHWDNHSWSAWKYLGGIVTSSPAAASLRAGQIDVFVRGTNGALYTRHYASGTWGPWASLGGQLLDGTGPAACSYRASGIFAFVTGVNHATYAKYWDGTTWQSWRSLGGNVTSSPAAASLTNKDWPGRVFVCARGSNGVLYYKLSDDGIGWSSWMSGGGQVLAGTSPAAANYTNDTVSWFVTGTNHQLYFWTGWTWTSLGGYLTSGPAAVSQTPGMYDVYVRGSTGDIYSRAGTWGSWGPWYKAFAF